jgi:GH15 family glucan-1,4-alpha-glucosidase
MALILTLTMVVTGSWTYQWQQPSVPLQQSTVAVGAGGAIVSVTRDDEVLVPGYRVLAELPDTQRQVAEQRQWLRAGTVPCVPELAGSTMVRDALLDLHVLTAQYGVTVAGWSPHWRYVWPRDSAFAAAAFARTGHVREATSLMDFLQRVQPADGVFQARYLPDGSGVPDGRGPQTDGLGWALWGLQQVADALPPAQQKRFVHEHLGLLSSSTNATLALIDNPLSLPPPSADYWEVREQQLTLSTAAVLLAGLRSAHALYVVAGDPEAAQRAAAGEARLWSATHAAFGPRGYPRQVGGGASSVDLGVSFLLPPFSDHDDPSLRQTWKKSTAYLARPAGGLAPGGSWRPDGISWTTSTSTYALTAAYLNDRPAAVRWLSWIDEHRTGTGSIPEKVLSDGRPASVAPLAWSAAAVIMAADQLQQDGHHSCAGHP